MSREAERLERKTRSSIKHRNRLINNNANGDRLSEYQTGEVNGERHSRLLPLGM